MDDADSNLTRSAHAAPAAEATPSRSVVARHWREGVRYFGLLRYLKELLSATWLALLEFLPSRRKARFGDLDFDWEHSVNTTRSNVNLQTQFITGVTGRPYFATEPWLFEQIMHQLALSAQHSVVSKESSAPGHESPDYSGLNDFTFIDLGAGKGRVLLMASDYAFQRIIGVELMPDLCRAAQENIANYSRDHQKCQQIEVSCMDARDFQFPAAPLVVYLFNPFSEPTFAAVLENLRQSVKQAPRQVYVAYRFTEFEGLLSQSGWLEKIAGEEQWAVYENRREDFF